MRKAETSEEDRRDDRRHALELGQLALDEGIGELVLPRHGADPAIAVEEPVDLVDHRRLVGAGQEDEAHGVEGAVEVVERGERLLGHPDHAEAPVVRHHVAGADGVDIFRREHDADDGEHHALGAELALEARPDAEAVGVGEVGVDRDLVGPRRPRAGGRRGDRAR